MSPRGRPERASTEDIIDAARNTEGPCFTTREVADQLPIGRERVSKRLRKLVEERDILNSKKAGTARVYWIVGY